MAESPAILSGRSALVTGGASGIGLAIARALADAGATVLIADLNGEAAIAAATTVGERAAGLAVDVADEAAVQAMVAAATRMNSGQLDIAVNNAGYGAFAPISSMDATAWRGVIDVCLTGVFLCIKHEAVVMTGGGAIVNIASLNARQPAEGMSAYCSAKAGVAMLTEVAALELGPQGVRVNAIGPGLIETPATSAFFSAPALHAAFVAETALGRHGTPAEVADLALFLVSDAARWMTGQTLYLDGGASLRKYPELFRFIPAEPAG